MKTLTKAFNQYAQRRAVQDMAQQRDADVRRLMKAKEGWAAMPDLMAAVYGAWPLAGLEQDSSVACHPVHLRVMHSKFAVDFRQPVRSIKEMMFKLGTASFDEFVVRLNEPAISLQKEMRNNSAIGVHNVLAHELTHILQYHESVMRAMEQSAPDGTLTHPGYTADHIVTQTLMPHMPDDGHQRSRVKKEMFDYLLSGIEQQARLQDGMTHGYTLWQRMPATQDELWAGLAALGLTPPSDVQAHLDGLPADHSARHFQSIAQAGLRSLGIENLCLVQQGMTDAGRHAYWHQTLPALYADMIEMMGDVPGRARFGLGENDTLARLRWYVTREPQNERQAEIKAQAAAANGTKPAGLNGP